jgi:hypothetical protein
LKKVPNIIKKCLIFSSDFFYSICFKSTKKTLQNSYFNFSRNWPLWSDHILFICYFKNHMTFFLEFSVETIWKYFGSSPHFLFKIFQTNFSGILSWKYWEWLLSLYSNISSFSFFALVYTLNHTFCNELRFGRNPSKPSLIKNKIFFTSLRLAQLVSRPVHHFKFNLFNSRKKIFLSMC